MRRVGMDFQLCRQGAHRGKGLPWLEIPANESLLGSEDQLVKDGSSVLELESEQRHMSNVTDRALSVKIFGTRKAVAPFSCLL